MRTHLIALMLLGAVAVSAPELHAQSSALAASSSAGPAWTELSPAQRAALAPLQAHWSSFDGERKAKWIAVADRFPAMSAPERERVQARIAQWAAMSPQERGRARQNYQELRRLSPNERQARWEAYRALSPEQRAALASRPAPSDRPRPAPRTWTPRTDAKGIVPVNPAGSTTRPVTPTVVQVEPGATTTLVGRPASPPAHSQPGMPRIAVTPGFVDPGTLLPSRGPQGAATIRVAPDEPAPSRPRAAEAGGRSRSDAFDRHRDASRNGPGRPGATSHQR